MKPRDWRIFVGQCAGFATALALHDCLGAFPWFLLSLSCGWYLFIRYRNENRPLS